MWQVMDYLTAGIEDICHQRGRHFIRERYDQYRGALCVILYRLLSVSSIKLLPQWIPE